jgi:hypothetical protein
MNEIEILGFDKEHIDSYSQFVRFEYNGNTYALSLHWSTYDGYDTVELEGDFDRLEEEMGEEAFDDLASTLEQIILVSDMKPND